jgi:anti-sigma regulatory factor (Ser/Thr protein kinase)
MKRRFQSPKAKRLIAERTRRTYKYRKKQTQERAKRSKRMRPIYDRVNPYPLTRSLHRKRLQRYLGPGSLRDPVGFREYLKAPSQFSLRDNPDEMVEFFARTHVLTMKGRKLYFDFGDIEHLTADAIIYLLSLREFYRDQSLPYSFEGNLPKNAQCRNTLISCGFFNYVHSVEPRHTPDTPDVFKIKFGSAVDPKAAHEFIDFARTILAQDKSSRSRAALDVVIEAMTNTRQHAYGPKVQGGKWGLFALLDRGSRVFTFVVADTGRGIPATVQRKLRERIGPQGDSGLILSALKGDIQRSRTKDPYRGLGLPAMWEHAQKGDIQNLTVISNRGFVRNSEARDLPKVLAGTMISWEFA